LIQVGKDADSSRAGQMFQVALLLLGCSTLSLAGVKGYETKKLPVPYELIPSVYLYMSIVLTILSIIGFLCFVVLYTAHSGCPNKVQQYTEVWRVDRSEQLNRFKIQKLAEQLLQERERRKVKECTRDEQF